MLDKGGNLNVLNRDLQTPLMFANEAVLRNLGMVAGVCSLHNNFTGNKFNNHVFLNKGPRSDSLLPDQ